MYSLTACKNELILEL